MNQYVGVSGILPETPTRTELTDNDEKTILGAQDMERTIPGINQTNNALSKMQNKKALLLFIILIGLVVSAFIWYSMSGRPELQANGVPISPEIEERYGVRFTFVALVAQEGLLDVRYRILDENKARDMGHYTTTTPVLINEDSGKAVDVTVMGWHNHRVERGRIYYTLIRNTGNAIQRGDKITIKIDDLELKHVPVR